MPPKVVAIILTTAILGIVAYYVLHTPPAASELYLDNVKEMIDRSQLTPEVAAFLAAAEENHTIGRKATEFPGLLKQMFPASDSSPSRAYTWYRFYMPMNEKHQSEFDQACSEGLGVPCWPELGVKVKNETQIILKNFVFTQCL